MYIKTSQLVTSLLIEWDHLAFFFLSKKKKVTLFNHSGHEKKTPPLACKICSSKSISICFSQIFSPQKELFHSTILHF